MRQSALLPMLLFTTAMACKRAETTAQSDAPSASASTTHADAGRPSASALARGVPIPAERVASAVNPKRRPVYSGPTGTIRGTVRMKGDRAPVDAALEVPRGCTLTRDMYGPLFREGMQRSLADVLVTATGYEGYVPPREPAKVVEARGCAWDARTLASTFGQRFEVVNKDTKSYMPRLVGARALAELVLVPGGDAIRLYPEQPGRYALKDNFHDSMHADVYVLKFATFDVTGLDGRYEIAGVPAGEVTVNTLLPALSAVAEKKVRLAPNATLELDFELSFERKEWAARPTRDAGADGAP
ncbi:MAG TPA: hypothetical protein VI072_07550 [Polyangiaceae bacterium]